jgi:hypothetical protein
MSKDRSEFGFAVRCVNRFLPEFPGTNQSGRTAAMTLLLVLLVACSVGYHCGGVAVDKRQTYGSMG